MGRLQQIGNVSIRVYANDHLPPHFHASTPDHEVLIIIETLTIYSGRLRRKDLRAALQWASDNRAAITVEWNRINPRFPIALDRR